MSYRFELSITRVQCLHEAVGEWGKDELRLIGFGISRQGTLFATGYRVLGSYGDGDVREGAQLAPPLVATDLPDDGLDVLFFAWLIEEDSGGVRQAAASLEAELRESYREKALALTEADFPRECIPFTAFYKAVLPLTQSLQDAATDGLNNDEVYTLPVDVLLRHVPSGPFAMASSHEQLFERSKNAGHYRFTLRHSYARNAVVLE